MVNGLNIGIAVIFIGIYGLLTRRNLIKIVMSLYVMNSGAILYFVSLGYTKGGEAAIYDSSARAMVDPLPQALMLTAIVIGLGITALGLALAIKIYENRKTLDVRRLIEQ